MNQKQCWSKSSNIFNLDFMHFKFEQLCPHVFQHQKLKSAIWNQVVEIKDEDKVLIHAISGTGKTSFIHYLLGLRQDYTGTIFIDHKRLSEIQVEEFTQIRKHKISTVFQDLQLFENLSVEENIKLLPELAKGYQIEDAKMMLDELDISDKWEQSVKTLSFGQKQRVAIIRALMKPFEFLICDEPFSHLDEQNTIKCTKLIEKRLEEENAGLILLALQEECTFKELKIFEL